MRVGLGIAFMLHGYPKITGGPEWWEQMGMAMKNIGISFAPVFWGFMASISEFGGGFLIVLGLFFRPACLLLFFTMLMATLNHIASGGRFQHLFSRPGIRYCFFRPVLDRSWPI